MRLVVAFFLTLASPVLAQIAADRRSPDLDGLRACLSENAETPDQCIGGIADPCQDEPDGSTTIGIGQCLAREAEAWDVILNESYENAVAIARETDERLSETTDDPGAESSLRAAQRAWIGFRDAECERRFTLNQEGTIRTVVATDCERTMTARRAIELSSSEAY